MADGIYSALSGAIAQSHALDVVANNLANATSTAFKADRLTFREVLKQTAGEANRSHPQVLVDGVHTDFRPGALSQTGNPLDAAIIGDGFFVVDTAAGERFTRAGSFSISDEGLLVDQRGQRVMGLEGAIAIQPGQPVRLDNEGNVWSGEEQMGRLRVVSFANPQRLARAGEGLWVPGRAASPTEVAAQLNIGAIELSNVSAVRSMTQMVTISRAYEAYHRAIETFRSLDGKTVNELT